MRLCLDEPINITGMVPHFRVASVLNEADIFLNTALTEAFCIAIVEAARMGLLTDVFGRITFNGRFYQTLILQVLIGFTRSHSIAFETCYYSVVALFAAFIAYVKYNEIE